MKYMNLTHVIEQSVSKYKIHANKKKQKMNYHKPNKEYKIYGDPERIEQVIKNIISNAVKYSPDGAEIIIQVFKEDNYINVAIKDTGMGISKDDADRIFDRFYRVDKARSREMGGTGLGLAIAKEIMEYHGGSITVESELGKGTCFYLKFPS
ncbi:MAG: sensor histidine kinase [Eubacteriales bacterium]